MASSFLGAAGQIEKYSTLLTRLYTLIIFFVQSANENEKYSHDSIPNGIPVFGFSGTRGINEGITYIIKTSGTQTEMGS